MIHYTIENDVLREPLAHAIHHWRKKYRDARDECELLPKTYETANHAGHKVAIFKQRAEVLKELLHRLQFRHIVDRERKPRVAAVSIDAELYELIFNI